MRNRSIINSMEKPVFITHKAPFDYIEAYKSLRANINFLCTNGKNRKIIVTSALPDEGKSSVSINLAISLVQAKNKVLLIDADLRNPSLENYLLDKKEYSLGLSNILDGEEKVGNCLTATKYGFDLITSGPIPPNPAELLTSNAMRELLQIAAKHYDYIICDAPPVAIVSDAIALSPLCDGILMVVRHKFANRSLVRRVINNFKAVEARVLGIVLSQYHEKRPTNRYGRYKEHGKYNYGYGYGYKQTNAQKSLFDNKTDFVEN